MLFLACGPPPGPTTPIRAAVMLPQTGPGAYAGIPMTQTALLAQSVINDSGGIGGRQLELVVVDSGGPSAERLAEAFAQDVVAVIGPISSGSLTEYMPILAENNMVALSPGSTLPALAADDLVFRTVTNDNTQARVMARYALDISAAPSGEVAVVHGTGSWGIGLKDVFLDRFTANGGTIIGSPISFKSGGIKGADLDKLWSDIVALSPKPKIIVTMAGAPDAVPILNKWAASGDLPGVQWIFADSTMSTTIFPNIPEKAAGIRGTSAVHPAEGDAFAFYRNAHTDAGMETKIGYVTCTWDAVFVLAAGLMQQQARYGGTSLGGANLKAALMDVSKGGQVMHAGQWRDIVALINRRGDVDYDGASGPIDFDETGEVVAPFQVWELTRNNGNWSFSSSLYVEAKQVASF